MTWVLRSTKERNICKCQAVNQEKTLCIIFFLELWSAWLVIAEGLWWSSWMAIKAGLAQSVGLYARLEVSIYMFMFGKPTALRMYGLWSSIDLTYPMWHVCV